MCQKCDDNNNESGGKFVIVFNLARWGLANMDLPFLKRYLNTLTNCYSERFGAILVVNSPYGTCTMWKFMKYWVDPSIRSRFIFCGKREFDDFIDREKMPYSLF